MPKKPSAGVLGQIKQAVCAVIEEVINPMQEDMKEKAKETYDRNRKLIDDALEVNKESCMRFPPGCQFQDCMKAAYEQHKRDTDANWAWYQQSWQRPKTSIEQGVSIANGLCQIF